MARSLSLRHYILGAGGGFLSSLFVSLAAFAGSLQGEIKNNLNITAVNYAGYNAAKGDLPTVVGGIIFAILSLLGVIFVVLIVYAGFKWMLAQGEEQKIKEAQSLITQSIIGLAIVLAAYAISYFVINTLQQAV